MNGFWWFLIILLVLIVALVIWGIGQYNSLVGLRNKVQESWRQIDVELQRRYDLIPNLVETVKGFAAHEQQTLENVIAMRNQARGLATQDAEGVPSEARTQAEAQLSQAVHNILVTAEAYPELKADAGFRQLANQLESTEDRIANGRRYYNAVVGNYNTKIESFPTNMIANMGGFRKAGYYEVPSEEMRLNPQVNFSDSPRDKAVLGSTDRSAPVFNPADDAQTREPQTYTQPQGAAQPLGYPQQDYPQQPMQYGDSNPNFGQAGPNFGQPGQQPGQFGDGRQG